MGRRKKLVAAVMGLNYHRNGMCGRPFYAVKFIDAECRTMVAVYFPHASGDRAKVGSGGAVSYDCAVLHQSFVEGVNVDEHFRGDNFAEEIADLIFKFRGTNR